MTSSWLMRSPSRRAARQPTMLCQNVELFGIQDRCDGRSLVVHRWTHERKLCGGAGRFVELVQNQNGDGAIAIGEEIRPVQDSFAIAIAECDAADQSDKHTALTRDGSFKRNVCELPAVFEKVSIVASHECSGSLSVFEGACFPYSACGGHIWWKVSWLYDCIGLSSHGGSCRWVQAFWPTWVKLASELALDPLHARRSLPSNSRDGGAGGRVLDWPSVSSHLLVGVLARLACSSVARGGCGLWTSAPASEHCWSTWLRIALSFGAGRSTS